MIDQRLIDYHIYKQEWLNSWRDSLQSDGWDYDEALLEELWEMLDGRY